MPSINDLNFDLTTALSTITVGPTDNDYIADGISTPVKVDEQSSKFYYIDSAQAARQNDTSFIRYEGADPVRVDFDITKDTVYKCIDHAPSKGVSYEKQARKQIAYNSIVDDLSFLVKRLKLEKEAEVWAAVLAAIAETGMTSSPSTKWETSTGNPITDMLLTGKKAIVNAGHRVTAVAGHDRVLDAMFCSADGVRLFAASGGGVQDQETYKNILARILGINPSNVFISKQDAVNTAQRGADASLSGLYSDSLLLFEKAEARQGTSGFMVTPTWSLGSVGGFTLDENGFAHQIYENERQSTTELIVHSYHDAGITLNPTAAYLFTNVITG